VFAGRSLKQSKNVVLQENMTSHSNVRLLTDDQLLAEAQRLAATERHATAELLRALIEVDTRRLYLREGCASLFTYCTQVLHLEEGAAYNRIETARTARRLPALLDAIVDGSLTLSSARLLAPHLTIDNYEELLKAARHRSKREVEVIVATLAPRLAVPTVLRKLPAHPRVEASVSEPTANTGAALPTAASAERPASSLRAGTLRSPSDKPSRASSSRSSVAPLSADTYKLQVTISAATQDKLRRARDLLRHSIPSGDLGELLDRALAVLLNDLERRRCGATTRPRVGFSARARARHIPAAVKREVWRRDEGRCAFSAAGRRCTETAFLEFHHVVPYAEGGAATVANIELRCRAHNQYEATLSGCGDGVVREVATLW
jgi:hypothetical protein